MQTDAARPPPRTHPGVLVGGLLAVFGGVALLPLRIGLARLGMQPSWLVLGGGLSGLVVVAAIVFELGQMRARPGAALASVLLPAGGSGALELGLRSAPVVLWLELDVQFAPERHAGYHVPIVVQSLGERGWQRSFAVPWAVGSAAGRVTSAPAVFFASSSVPRGTVPPERGVDVTYGEGRYRGYARLCTIPAQPAPLSLQAAVGELSWARSAHLRLFAAAG